MRILSIDYGTKFTGLAISDKDGKTAMPLQTIEAAKQHILLKSLEEVVKTYEPEQILYGNPVNSEGEPTAMSKEVKEFVKKLGKKTGLAMLPWDERDTSIHANQKFRQTDSRIHSEAARMMLQEYLDHQNATKSPKK